MDCSTPGFPVLHYPRVCSNSYEFGLMCQTPLLCQMMPSNHLILCHPLLLLPSIFPSIRVFSNESALLKRWPKYWSFSFSISPSKDIQGWFSLGLTGLVSLQSKRLSAKVFSEPQFKSISSSVLSLLYGSTLTSVHDY